MTYLPSFSKIVCLVLSLVAIFGTDAAAQSQDTPDGIHANPLQGQSLDRLTATRNRPLFSPNRRPALPPPPQVERTPEPPAPPPPPSVILFGIVIDEEGARAIVRSEAEKIDRVKIGNTIGEWTVSQIEARQLVLSLDDRLVTFTLFNEMAPQRAEPQPTNLTKRRRSRN
jgi:hypothetical protein